MKSALNYLRNLFCYCGIEKDEYNAIKKDAYVSNFKVWRILHILMAAVFAFLYIGSLLFDLMSANSLIYLVSLIYSVGASVYFFIANIYIIEEIEYCIKVFIEHIYKIKFVFYR